MLEDDEAEFAAFVRSRSRDLRGVAWLLTGDWATAETLGCSVGTIKAHASRALRTLRADRTLQASMSAWET